MGSHCVKNSFKSFKYNGYGRIMLHWNTLIQFNIYKHTGANSVQRMWPSWEFISVLSFIHYIICGGIWHTKALKRFLKNEKINNILVSLVKFEIHNIFFSFLNNTQLVDVLLLVNYYYYTYIFTNYLTFRHVRIIWICLFVLKNVIFINT